VKNVFLLDPGEPLTGKQLKLLGTKLVQHWKNLLDIWDAFQRTRKKEKYEDALETVANRPGKSVKAVSTIKKALTQTHSLISEVAKGRFYTPSSI